MPNDFNDKIIKDFRANAGAVGGPFKGMPMVLVHSTGAKTREVWVNPLAYQRIDDRTVAIFASKGGSPTTKRRPKGYGLSPYSSSRGSSCRTPQVGGNKASGSSLQ